jgi:acetolactate synthase-1/2/3 large subunit
MATTSGLSSSAQNLTWRFLQAQMLGMHGTVAANFAVDRADLLLAIGVRFDDRVTGKLEAFAARARIVHIDIDPAEINKNKHSHITVCADARPSLQARAPWLYLRQQDRWGFVHRGWGL